jgi:hypothetical protein
LGCDEFIKKSLKHYRGVPPGNNIVSTMLIHRCGQRASLLKHISFAGPALDNKELVQFLPEILPVIKYFGPNSISQWRSNMELDRNIVGQSLRMGLLSRLAAERVLAPTLDDYMLEMHCEKVAAVLESFTCFARRIVPLIRSDPDAPCWWINSEILVQRKDWSQLSRRVSALVKTIIQCLETDRIRKRSNVHASAILRSAAHEASWIYGRH